jgi:hypothetical protein
VWTVDTIDGHGGEVGGVNRDGRADKVSHGDH